MLFFQTLNLVQGSRNLLHVSQLWWGDRWGKFPPAPKELAPCFKKLFNLVLSPFCPWVCGLPPADLSKLIYADLKDDVPCDVSPVVYFVCPPGFWTLLSDLLLEQSKVAGLSAFWTYSSSNECAAPFLTSPSPIYIYTAGGFSHHPVIAFQPVLVGSSSTPSLRGPSDLSG